jgi:hypothetical protein
MLKNQKQYMDSYLYEALMKRAFRSERNFGRGIDNSVFRLLEHIENGHYGKPADYPKQVRKIKEYLAKAVAKIQLWKLTDNERADVGLYAGMALNAAEGDGLATAIDGLLNATQRFKEY